MTSCYIKAVFFFFCRIRFEFKAGAAGIRPIVWLSLNVTVNVLIDGPILAFLTASWKTK